MSRYIMKMPVRQRIEHGRFKPISATNIKNIRSCAQTRKLVSGFTLTELIVVILLVGILSANALPKLLDLRREARIAVLRGLEAGLLSGIGQVRNVYYGFKTSVSSSPDAPTSYNMNYVDIGDGDRIAVIGETLSDLYANYYGNGSGWGGINHPTPNGGIPISGVNGIGSLMRCKPTKNQSLGFSINDCQGFTVHFLIDTARCTSVSYCYVTYSSMGSLWAPPGVTLDFKNYVSGSGDPYTISPQCFFRYDPHGYNNYTNQPATLQAHTTGC